MEKVALGGGTWRRLGKRYWRTFTKTCSPVGSPRRVSWGAEGRPAPKDATSSSLETVTVGPPTQRVAFGLLSAGLTRGRYPGPAGGASKAAGFAGGAGRGRWKLKVAEESPPATGSQTDSALQHLGCSPGSPLWHLVCRTAR